jgi:protein ImuB
VQCDAPDPVPDVPFPDRPLWLLKPTPVDRPAKILGRPERIEAGWWSGVDATRDYYLAISREGARWWLYREVGSDHWTHCIS